MCAVSLYRLMPEGSRHTFERTNPKGKKKTVGELLASLWRRVLTLPPLSPLITHTHTNWLPPKLLPITHTLLSLGFLCLGRGHTEKEREMKKSVCLVSRLCFGRNWVCFFRNSKERERIKKTRCFCLFHFSNFFSFSGGDALYNNIIVYKVGRCVLNLEDERNEKQMSKRETIQKKNKRQIVSVCVCVCVCTAAENMTNNFSFSC